MKDNSPYDTGGNDQVQSHATTLAKVVERRKQLILEPWLRLQRIGAA